MLRLIILHHLCLAHICVFPSTLSSTFYCINSVASLLEQGGNPNIRFEYNDFTLLHQVRICVHTYMLVCELMLQRQCSTTLVTISHGSILQLMSLNMCIYSFNLCHVYINVGMSCCSVNYIHTSAVMSVCMC